jgi:hypothetical protein
VIVTLVRSLIEAARPDNCFHSISHRVLVRSFMRRPQSK